MFPWRCNIQPINTWGRSTCSGTTCHVIDQIFSLLHGSPSPWSPYAAGHWPTQRQFFLPNTQSTTPPSHYSPCTPEDKHLLFTWAMQNAKKVEHTKMHNSEEKKKKNLRTPHRHIYFVYCPSNRTAITRMVSVCFLNISHLFPYFISNTPTQICAQKQTHTDINTQKKTHLLGFSSEVMVY